MAFVVVFRTGRGNVRRPRSTRRPHPRCRGGGGGCRGRGALLSTYASPLVLPSDHPVFSPLWSNETYPHPAGCGRGTGPAPPTSRRPGGRTRATRTPPAPTSCSSTSLMAARRGPRAPVRSRSPRNSLQAFSVCFSCQRKTSQAIPTLQRFTSKLLKFSLQEN